MAALERLIQITGEYGYGVQIKRRRLFRSELTGWNWEFDVSIHDGFGAFDGWRGHEGGTSKRSLEEAARVCLGRYLTELRKSDPEKRVALKEAV